MRPIAQLMTGCLLLAGLAVAVPAPSAWRVGEAEGRAFSFRMMGDEFANWAVDEAGHTLLMDGEACWRHARLDSLGALQPTGELYRPGRAAAEDSRGLRPAAEWLEREIAPRRARLAAASTRRQRVEGQWNLLVILIHYPDQQPIVAPGQFNSMMNQPGWRGTGSFNDYYLDMSYGLFSTLSTVTVWHQASHDHDYYGYNQGWDRSRELVREAVLAADSSVDFSQFDNDGNGVVDALLVVHSGNGAEEGNSSNIWSHRWSLWGQELQLDGVTVSDYTIQPELQGGVQSAIGVYVHEFGHALGLPDLYDTDYSSSGVGNWCVMSGGSWGGGGSGGNAHVPSAMSAYCRQAMGWANVITTSTELVDHGLPAAHLSDEILRLDLESFGQYFLVENRRLAAWDRHQPAEGLYIWHVDESQDGNSNEDRPLVDLEQADGRRDLNHGSGSDASDLFPGTSNNRLFSNQTNPSSLPYGGQDSPISISGIGDSADTLFASYFQLFSHQDLAFEGWTAADDDNGNGWPDPGESLALSLQLTNRGAALESIELELLIDVPGITVQQGQVVAGPLAHNGSFSTPPFQILLSQALADGAYPLELRSRDGAGWEQTITGSLQVGRMDLLLLLDGPEAALGDWYAQALAGEPTHELRARPAGSPPPVDLSAYPAVIWVCAATSAPLSSADISAMGAYLAGGGRLLVSGQRLLDGLPGNGRALLGADPGPLWSGPPSVRGWSDGGLLLDGDVLLLSGANGAWNQILPTTTLAMRQGSVQVARWGTSAQTAVLRREDPAWSGGRLIVAAASLEAIHGATGLMSLETVLERFIEWLESGTLVGVEAAPQAGPAPASLTAWPNPFNPSTQLGIRLTRADQAMLRVWNLAGELVHVADLGRLAAGDQVLQLDLSGKASGLYVAELRTEGGLTLRTRLALVR